ncbi:STAS domain-containing protein [Streptomyces rubiginosohelvolus]
MFVVVACGDFDADERDLLLSAWDEADDRNLPVTVLDLSGVTFGDSSFLDSLLLAHRRHHAANRRLVLAGPLHRLVVLLLTVTGTLPHFETAAASMPGYTRTSAASAPDGEARFVRKVQSSALLRTGDEQKTRSCGGPAKRFRRLELHPGFNESGFLGDSDLAGLSAGDPAVRAEIESEVPKLIRTPYK